MLTTKNVLTLIFSLTSGWGRFVSFRFRFPGTGCLAFRFVGAYGSVRFAKMIGSFRFVSFRTYLTYFPFRFVSFPFHRRFVTSVSSLEDVGDELAVQEDWKG